MRLIDADALRIEHCKDCSVAVQESCKADPVCASLMWVNEAPTIAQPTWISCAERLPAGDTVVLCYRADGKIRFGILLDATYADGVQAFMDRDRVFAFGVTHWMPLPEPPKGE